jgi:hypothetical protein
MGKTPAFVDKTTSLHRSRKPEVVVSVHSRDLPWSDPPPSKGRRVKRVSDVGGSGGFSMVTRPAGICTTASCWLCWK